jgi:phosphoribosylglycinamide formyltransferase-1
MTLKAGIIGSSGGSALMAAVHCLRDAGFRPELCVVADRDCGLLRWAQREGFPSHRLLYESAAAFSASATEIMRAEECSDVLLYFTRRVSSPLLGNCRVRNIHPSLLPAFPGLHGVRDSWRAGVPLLGATLHEVDDGLDTGPIKAQVACAMPSGLSLDDAERLSYAQKVYLTLCWFEAIGVIPCAVRSAAIVTCASTAVTVASTHLAHPKVAAVYRFWSSNLFARQSEQRSRAS